jgi:hypothetical protein
MFVHILVCCQETLPAGSFATDQTNANLFNGPFIENVQGLSMSLTSAKEERGQQTADALIALLTTLPDVECGDFD